MKYLFATERQNYSDYASGKVFYGLPEHPAFPIRLASEILQRCFALCKTTGRCVLYDPCCGGAYHLATLAYLHWDRIDAIAGSDINADALALAERNLALLTAPGLERRIAEIDKMRAAYGKASHEEALKSAQRLQHRLQTALASHQIKTRLFCADAMDSDAIQTKLGGAHIDVIFTDVPYGKRSTWQSDRTSQTAMDRLIESLLPVLSSDAVVAIACDKQQKARHERYRQAERFRIGKRQVFILRPKSSP
jgi:methylase of polypeptide subunit release factors